MYPVYQDMTTHLLFGKSKLPFFIVHHTLSSNFPLHHHCFAELSFVIAGKGTEILNGRPHPIRRGTVSLLLPHHMHELRIEAPVVKYNCMFDLNIIFSCFADHELGKMLLQTGSGLPSHYDLDEGFTLCMEKIMEQLMQEYHSDGVAKDTVIRSKLLEALVFLARTKRIAEKSEPLSSSSDSKLLQVLLYLHLHYRKEVSLNEVAKLFNWNASYLSRMFYRYAGRTFTDYLHLLRIGQAATLLVTTQMKVIDISFEVGFDHIRTFIRVFKKWKGTNPSDYRKRHQTAAFLNRLDA